MATQFTLPRQVKINVAGRPYAGAQAFFYQTNTETPQQVFQDSALTVLHAQPVLADDDGYFPVVWLDENATVDYRVRILSATGSLLDDVSDIQARAVTTTQIISDVTQNLDSLKLTAAETATGVTPTNFAYPSTDINVLRYGIVPNDLSKRTQNTTILSTLLDPTKNGPRGRLIFPPINGADTYHFNGMIQIRDGVTLDLCGCTLNFAKSYAPADDTYGFLTFIRDVTIENGTITVQFDGTGGINAGPIMRLGARNGYGFGSFPAATFDEEDFDAPMGNLVLRNLRLTTNNPAVAAAILGLGGLRGVRIENVRIDGQGVLPGGILFEFGDWHYEVTVANRKSAHATGVVISNVTVTDCDETVSGASGVELTGVAQATVENLTVDNAQHGFVYRPGEALFYNVGTPDVGLTKRCITLRNILCKNIAGTGLVLTGAESNASGYLSSVSLTESQQVDLMRFSVDGFIVSAAVAGINISGPCDIRNGTLNGGASNGQLIITDECIRGVFTNVEVRNSSSIGVRANFGGGIFATPRLKMLIFDNCQVAGNAGTGSAFAHTKSVQIRGGTIGYTTARDGVSETTQTTGVLVDATAAGGGVYCYGVDVATSGGNAYSITGTVTNSCGIFNPKGTKTFAGSWEIDGVAQATQAQLQDKTSFINTVDKVFLKKCWDTTNTRLMIAQGPLDTDTWKVPDNSATFTPA